MLSFTSRLFVLLLGIVSVVGFSAPAPASPQDISFISTLDGSTQQYVLIAPAAQTSKDVLIALHGHGSDRQQFASGTRDEARAARDVAAEHGMLFVSPDYRATTSWMGPAAEADMVQIIAALKRDHGAQRIFLCGGSMGGTAALTFAALHPDLVNGVASMNGTANLVEFMGFQEAIQASFGGSKEQKPKEYQKRSAEFYPERLQMPVAIAAGAQDNDVPPESVVRLAEALKMLGSPVLLLYRQEGGHSTTYEDARAVIEYIIATAGPPHNDRNIAHADSGSFDNFGSVLSGGGAACRSGRQ